MRTRRILIALTVCVVALVGCGVNTSYRIDDGTTRTGGILTVNGSIRVGSDCTIGGDCTTVNGRIEVGDRTKVEDLQTVNGRITVGEDCLIDGDLGTVNGRVNCGSGSRITGEVGTVNGDITLDGASAEHDVTTVNGDVELSAGAFVGGDIVISGNSKSGSGIEIRIADGSIVAGDVRVKSKRKVRVVLSGGGEVQGKIKGAEVVREDESVKAIETPSGEEGTEEE
ncbi:MAG: hypothetical protein ABFS37_02765 [Acidobacteriota bacterium]